MKTINLLAIIHVFSASSGVVYSTIKTGQITQKSHPMLSSLFNLADDIRKHQTTKTAKHKCDANSGDSTNRKGVTRDANSGDPTNRKGVTRDANSGDPTNRKGVTRDASSEDPTNRKGVTRDANSGNPTKRKGVAKTNPQQIKDEIFFPVKNHVTDKPIDTSHNFDIGNMLFLNTGKGMTENSDVLHTVKTNTKSDMCSQCRQRRDAKCVAIHCRSDGISNVPSRKGRIHLKSQPALDTLPVFSDKVNVRNRLDKPGTPQLKNVNSPPGQNVLGIFSLDRLPLNQRKTGKVTADPIWLLPDELFDTLRSLPLNRVPNKEGRIELAQETITKKMRPADKTESTVAINSDPALNMHLSEINVNGPIVNRRIMFPARNVGSTVPSVDQQTDKTIHWNEGLVDHVNNPPLEVPTNTLMQLVKNDELPLLPSARKTDNIGNSSILHEYNSVKSADTDTKNVKNNGTNRKPLNTDRHNNVNKSTSMSDVQTVSDKVPDVTDGQIPMNRLTLVVKNIGNTEQIAVHMGDGPIPTGMRLFETRRQYSISKQANVQPTDSHSFHHTVQDNQLLPEQSHQTMNHKHSPENFHKSMNHQSLSEDSNQTTNHQHSPENFHKSMNHQSLSEHSSQTMNHQHSPENAHKSMNHQNLPEHSNKTMNHQHPPENFHKSMNHQSLSEHSNQALNHQHSPQNFDKSMNHQSFSEHSNHTTNHQHSPENVDKSMNHQNLSEHSNETTNHQHSPQNVDKSMNHQNLSEHSNQTMNHQHPSENFHKSMNHQSLSEHSNQALNHQHSPENFDKSMNYQSLSEHSNQTMNHQHSPENYHKSMNHQSLSEHYNHTTNHQHSPENVDKSMNHQNLSEHSNETMNHQHSPENSDKSMNHQSLSEHSNQTVNHQHSPENFHKSRNHQSLSDHSNQTMNHKHSPSPEKYHKSIKFFRAF
ncbi:GATA zinc finger domain-containing protein 14-like [Mercenaria mercenaria]|uniref:GATA zinc finger domain-containing protein 14-like n=1 Tax=Mercenaria mercenaria TaxID=6596 RepID=UPI00234F0BB3|nr:GATA zinc finger domain-containing protein 14-like [Mercenaria mercenaria]